jgi:single-strand DNA-binding protein
MASLNKVMLIGNVGRDPEMRYTANGVATTSFSLAVNFRQRSQANEGQWEDATEWFNIVCWRDLAERVSQYVTKGKQLYIEGRLQTRNWDDDQGVRHYRTEVIANQVLFLGSRDGGAGGDWEPGSQPTRGGAPRGMPRGGGGDIDADDLPFE